MDERENDVSPERPPKLIMLEIFRGPSREQRKDHRARGTGNAGGIRPHGREEEQSDVGEKSKAEEEAGPHRERRN